MMDLGFKSTDFCKAKDVKIPDIFYNRMKTGIPVLDDWWHEGILPGSTFTVVGTPGAGKTTLMLQMMEGLQNNYNIGYCAGEESIEQLAFTCNRLDVNTNIANKVNAVEIAELTEHFDMLMVDSFATLQLPGEGRPKVREEKCLLMLTKAAKDNNCVIGFNMHRTVDGKMKGGTMVPHTVDVNIEIESYGDSQVRVIQFTKNRFGPLNSMELIMNMNGYDFDANPADLGNFALKKDKEVQEYKKPKKNSRAAAKQAQLDQIMEYMDSNIKAKVPDLVQFADMDVQKLGRYMRELEAVGKVNKWGRGKLAYWKSNKPTDSADPVIV